MMLSWGLGLGGGGDPELMGLQPVHAAGGPLAGTGERQ